ncbi:MAG: diadenylate cyclase [Pseudomonadota bacterium]
MGTENLWLFFRSIRWHDLIDIMVNSYLIFRLFVLFRGTHVFRVIIGIAFLWFFQRVAVFLGLVVTSWAMQGITAVAALIIIIVFRNEIRSVLQAKNVRAFLWGIPRKAVETPIEIIVESVYEMAKRRIGALIVFPGMDDLGEFIHSQIPWRGVVSKEMIMSIFWHDNPVHDGAAIIKSDRIQEVGALLPLSHRKDLPSHYGTRHRAAAGLAENTDALVVVVSEERGNVSVAKGPRIRAIRGKEELINLLKEHTGSPERGKGFFKREKLEFLVAGLVSFLFISVVWFSFTRGFHTIITLEVPIEYTNRDPSMEILDASVDTARVHLSGSAVLIKSLRPEQVQIKIDLSHGVVGSNSYALTQENISLPPGVKLKKVIPSTVEVTLDVLVKKTVPVQVDWIGKLPEDLILREVTLDPEKIQVIGGDRILKDVPTIYTEKVSLDSIRESGAIIVKPLLQPASLKMAPNSKGKVRVTYVVDKRS